MARWRATLLGAAYTLCVLLGALVFWALEAPREREAQRATWARLAEIRSSIGDLSCYASGDTDELVAFVLEAYRVGVITAEGSLSNLTHWDYDSAVFFAGTIVTTIGYGHLAPATVGGKVFCIVFATFGIPLNVVVMNKVGGVILRSLDRIAGVLKKRGFKKSSTQILTMGVFVGLGFPIFLLIPSVVFMMVEGWSYAESTYFSFITLSTIGFGDFVVGNNPRVHYTPLYKTMVAVWIICGLAWLSAIFSAITALLERVGEELGRREDGEHRSGQGPRPADPGHGDTEDDDPGHMGETGMPTLQGPNSGGKTGGDPISGRGTHNTPDFAPMPRTEAQIERDNT